MSDANVDAKKRINNACLELFHAAKAYSDPNRASDLILDWTIKQFLPSSQYWVGLIAYATNDEIEKVVLMKCDVSPLLPLLTDETDPGMQA